MPGLIPDVDPDGLLEYSVVYTDRALNHMSRPFQEVMRDIHTSLTKVYNTENAIVVPGSGTFAMEAVARQFATDKKCLVIRNGWFSYRWSQIFEAGKIPASSTVLKAKPVNQGPQASFAPTAIEEAIATIESEKPDVVFAPHVETSAGMMLPNSYIKSLADAAHKVGGMLVLDCIASGTIWVDMQDLGVDVLISAPQKGWSGSPCCGLVMLNNTAKEKLATTTSSSFACDLKKWQQIMQAYLDGGHAYHATMPTDGLRKFRDVMKETEAYGFERVHQQQQKLGDKVRTLLATKGIKSVAAPGFRAPAVVVSYTSDQAVKSGQKFVEHGLQIAAGVPLQCDEPDDFQTFRIGLFGLDKLQNIRRTMDSLERVLDKIWL